MRRETLWSEAVEREAGLRRYREGEAATSRAEVERMQKLLLRALADLTDRQREMLTLYYFENQTMPQIARMTGLNKATVCRHIQKGRKELERLLRYAWGGAADDRLFR